LCEYAVPIEHYHHVDMLGLSLSFISLALVRCYRGDRQLGRFSIDGAK